MKPMVVESESVVGMMKPCGGGEGTGGGGDETE